MKIQKIIDRLVEAQELPGINILIQKKGNDILYHQAGFRNLEKKEPMDRNTIFRMYSMTKPLTGFAAMILLERGQITLGDAVEKYIPEFATIKVAEEGTKKTHVRRRPIYLKDLLCMTSGLAYPDENKENTSGYSSKQVFDRLDKRLHGKKPMTTMEFAKSFGKDSVLSFEPGSAWQYGTGADIMGAVIEKVSGKKLSEFMADEVFKPLEMEDTAYYCPKEKQDRLAQPYAYPEWIPNPFAPVTEKKVKEGDWKLLDRDHLGILRYGSEDPAFVSGGAGVFSTLDDYAKFARMLLNKGEYRGKRVLSEQMTGFFTSGGLTPWQMDSFWRSWDSLAGYDYGNFMRVATGATCGQCPQIKGEYGWDGWLGTFFMNVPEKDITVLVGTQVGDAGALSYLQLIRNAVYVMM